MLNKHIKKYSYLLFSPLVKRLNLKDPSFMTFLSIVFSFLGAIFSYLWVFSASFLFFFLSFIADNLDGVVAKVRNDKNELRKYYDSITDRINEFMMIFPLAFTGFAFESFLALSISYLNSYARARAWHKKEGNWPSIGERSDRMVLFLLLYLIASLTTGVVQFYSIKILLYVIAILSLIGLIKRTFYSISFYK